MRNLANSNEQVISRRIISLLVNVLGCIAVCAQSVYLVCGWLVKAAHNCTIYTLRFLEISGVRITTLIVTRLYNPNAQICAQILFNSNRCTGCVVPIMNSPNNDYNKGE